MSFYHPPPATIEVYSPDFTTIHKVPSSAVIQVPLAKLKLKRLVECLNFAAARDAAPAQITDVRWCSTACRAGSNCKFVHIAQPLSKFPGHPIHVHYIWQSLDDVMYTRQWGGPCEDAPTLWLMNPPVCHAEVKRYDEQRAQITASLNLSAKKLQQHHLEEDEKIAHDMEVDLIASMSPNIIVPATRLLKTVGASTYLQRRQSALKPDYPLTPCPDYTCHNECRMGEDCTHAHVINLDVSQSTPFVRRTLRHVKAASEATMVQNEGRVQNGLFGMISGRYKPVVVKVHGGQMTAICKTSGNGASGNPGNTNSYSNGVSFSNDVSKNHSTETPSSGKQPGSSDEVPVGVADTETSSSPMQFNASTLATHSTGNSDTDGGSESGSCYKGNGYESSNGQPSITSDTQSYDTDDTNQ